jgi:hypothetical protein
MQDVNVEIPTFFPAADRIIAVGDVHGDVNALAGCLKVSASCSLSLSRALCAFPSAPCRLVPTWRSGVMSEMMQRKHALSVSVRLRLHVCLFVYTQDKSKTRALCRTCTRAGNSVGTASMRTCCQPQFQSADRH